MPKAILTGWNVNAPAWRKSCMTVSAMTCWGLACRCNVCHLLAESKHELLDLLEQVRGEVRCISHELMPPKFQYVTLAETIEAYIERLVIPASMQLAFSKENDHAEWGQVPEQTAYEVYRILQELLSNILKHSEATEVNINLSLSKELLVLLITDNGKPFSDSGAAMGGIGLNTTQERAKAIGGSLSVNCKGSIQQFQLEIPLSL